MLESPEEPVDTLAFNIQSVCVIHGFCICEFAYSLKFICNSQINTQSVFTVLHGQSDEKSESPDVHIHPRLKLNKCPSASLFQLLL